MSSVFPFVRHGRGAELAEHCARRLEATGETVSVCLPARNEEQTVGPIVAAIVRDLKLRCPVVAEVIVMDDSSDDRTAGVAADAGAHVVQASEVLSEYGRTQGKGDVLWRSLAASCGSLVVWCDADLRCFDTTWILRLIEPMLRDERVGLVKGSYDRPEDEGGGGRVTELLARPMLALLWPELAWIRQPLGGEYAGRRSVLEQQQFECDYGVEIGLLIDIAESHGVNAVAQAELGVRRHRHRTLSELHVQATSVASAMLRRGVVPMKGEVPAGGRGLADGRRLEALMRPPLALLRPFLEVDPNRFQRSPALFRAG